MFQDKFLETHKVTKLTQEELENLNGHITSKETELVIKTHPKQQARIRWFYWWFLSNFRRRHVNFCHTGLDSVCLNMADTQTHTHINPKIDNLNFINI